MDAAYLKATVADVLKEGVATAAILQVDDPIDWLAGYLQRAHGRMQEERRRREEEADALAAYLAAQEAAKRLAKLKAKLALQAGDMNEHHKSAVEYINRAKSREKTMAPEKNLQEVVYDVAETPFDPVGLEGDVPLDVQVLLRAGLRVCGYASGDIESWDDTKALLRDPVMFRRFSSFPLLAHLTEESIGSALKMIHGIDTESSLVLGHVLGPTVARFLVLLRACYLAKGKPLGRDLVTWASFCERNSEAGRTGGVAGGADVASPEKGSPQPASKGLPEAEGEAEEEELVAHSTKPAVWFYPGDGEFAPDPSERHRGMSTLQQMDTFAIPKSAVDKGFEVSITWMQEGGACDIDASVVLMSSDMVCKDTVYSLQQRSRCGGVRHKGDLGADAEAEGIDMDLNLVPKEITCLGIILNSAADEESLQFLQRAGVKLNLRADVGTEQALTLNQYAFNPGRSEAREVLVGLLYRDGDGWTAKAIGEPVPYEKGRASNNYYHAMPLVREWMEICGIHTGKHDGPFFNPFGLVAGDEMTIPNAALESPIRIGMGWDVTPGIDMDLDCSLVTFAGDKQTDYCDFEKLVSTCGAIQHQGDNQDGEGEGDDETITINFKKLDPAVTSMFLFCTVYEGGKLGDCDNLHIRMTTLKEQEKQKEICRFSLEHIDSSSASDEAMILARLTRQADSWHFVTIGYSTMGKTVEQLTPQLGKFLAA